MIRTKQTLSPAENAISSGRLGRGGRIFRLPRAHNSPSVTSLRYSLDIFNLTNTASFDIPIDDVSQNINFNGFPAVGQPSATKPCDTTFSAIYVCTTLSGLGITNKTIGSPRQIQMSLKLNF